MLKWGLTAGDGDAVGILEPTGVGMRFNFSSLLDMCRVTGKYMGVEDEDEEGKIRSHFDSLPCLLLLFESTRVCIYLIIII